MKTTNHSKTLKGLIKTVVEELYHYRFNVSKRIKEIKIKTK